MIGQIIAAFAGTVFISLSIVVLILLHRFAFAFCLVALLLTITGGSWGWLAALAVVWPIAFINVKHPYFFIDIFEELFK